MMMEGFTKAPGIARPRDKLGRKWRQIELEEQRKRIWLGGEMMQGELGGAKTRRAGGQADAKQAREEAEAMPYSSTQPSSAWVAGLITGAPVIERAIEVLIDVLKLVEMQPNDPSLNSVRESLWGHATEEPVPDIDCYVLDHLDFLWHVRIQDSFLAIPKRLVSDLLALVRSQHGHPGIAITSILLRNHFYRPQQGRHARDYVLSWRRKRRKRSQT